MRLHRRRASDGQPARRFPLRPGARLPRRRLGPTIPSRSVGTGLHPSLQDATAPHVATATGSSPPESGRRRRSEELFEPRADLARLGGAEQARTVLFAAVEEPARAVAAQQLLDPAETVARQD